MGVMTMRSLHGFSGLGGLLITQDEARRIAQEKGYATMCEGMEQGLYEIGYPTGPQPTDPLEEPRLAPSWSATRRIRDEICSEARRQALVESRPPVVRVGPGVRRETLQEQRERIRQEREQRARERAQPRESWAERRRRKQKERERSRRRLEEWSRRKREAEERARKAQLRLDKIRAGRLQQQRAEIQARREGRVTSPVPAVSRRVPRKPAPAPLPKQLPEQVFTTSAPRGAGQSRSRQPVLYRGPLTPGGYSVPGPAPSTPSVTEYITFPGEPGPTGQQVRQTAPGAGYQVSRAGPVEPQRGSAPLAPIAMTRGQQQAAQQATRAYGYRRLYAL